MNSQAMRIRLFRLALARYPLASDDVEFAQAKLTSLVEESGYIARLLVSYV